jgi:succinate dehydrogenase / fumarate reductase flavoprotein subunit
MAELELINGYPKAMRESIKLVEQTRSRRMNKLPPQMSMKEREAVLSTYHPDYVEGGKRTISIGPNTGDLAPHEVVDLLEAWPLVNPAAVNLAQVDCDVDVLIIGGGLAGTSAALLAMDKGIPVDRIRMVNKLRHGDANSMMAQGGTQAADRPEDSPVIHYLDIMGGGHFANKPDVARALAEDAPIAIKWMSELGVLFDRNEDGSYLELSGGGTSRKRMHACHDYTGMEELRTLRDEFRNRGIPNVEYNPAVELLTDPSGRVNGAVMWDTETEEYKVARAKAVIIATGGFGRLHIRSFPTTNHYGATADGIVLAYRAGARLRDTDTVQYHPTGAAFPQQIIGLLLTEKLRTSGAQPVNKFGEEFVFPLEPRDVEAAAIIRECYGAGNGIETPTGMRGVWLDTPLIDRLNGRGATEKSFPAMVRMMKRFGIDMVKDPILVFPTLHYQNGGVETDPMGRTNVEGLFVAGEVTGGVHGKNRLMGNSTMDCVVFGRRAGMAAAEYVRGIKDAGEPGFSHLERYKAMLQEAGIKTERKAPILFPDYRGRRVVERRLDLVY